VASPGKNPEIGQGSPKFEAVRFEQDSLLELQCNRERLHLRGHACSEGSTAVSPFLYAPILAKGLQMD
jgi:hypothetical protein